MSMLRKLFRSAPRETPDLAQSSGDSRASASAGVTEAVSAMIADGRLGPALALVDRQLETSPDDAVLWFARGSTMLAWGRLREVAASFDRAKSAGLTSAATHSEWGRVFLQLGHLDDAETALRRAVAIEPCDAAARLNLAHVLQARGHPQEAALVFASVLEIDPHHIGAMLGLAETALAQGAYAEAEEHARRATSVGPARADAWNHLGVALDRLQRHDDAIDALATAERLEAATDQEGSSYANLGVDLLDAGRVEEALDVFRRNLPHRSTVDGHFHYALALLTDGQFAEGWEHYEFRRLRNNALLRRPSVRMPVWNGQRLRGRTILLRAEQGVGDSIQFLRYAPLLKAAGARVLFHPSAELGSLAQRFSGIDEVIEEGAAPPYDFHALLMSLPRGFGIDLASIPADVPYLHPDPDRVARWAQRLPVTAARRVGLVWAGSATHVKDHCRSIALASLAALSRWDGLHLYSLQKGPAAAEIGHLPHDVDLVDLGGELECFDDTAAAISQLDLVISVDTAVAHLAGAMGKPVWMLVPRPADWRWLQNREDSPWYPTLRMFRQTRRGDWSDVIDRIDVALGQWLRTSACGRNSAPEVRETRSAVEPRHLPPALTNEGIPAVAETREGILQYLPADGPAGPSIGWYGQYLQGQVDFLARLLRPADVVVEADAGVGVHTLPLARAVEPQGLLLAYERRAGHRRLLVGNLRANGLTNVVTIERTLGDDESVDDLRLDRLALIKTGGNALPLAILAGASDTIWRHRPALFLAVKDGIDIAPLAECAKEFGYRCWRVSTTLFDPRNFNLRDEDIFSGLASLALLALPEETEPPDLPDHCVPVE